MLLGVPSARPGSEATNRTPSSASTGNRCLGLCRSFRAGRSRGPGRTSARFSGSGSSRRPTSCGRPAPVLTRRGLVDVAADLTQLTVGLDNHSAAALVGESAGRASGGAVLRTLAHFGQTTGSGSDFDAILLVVLLLDRLVGILQRPFAVGIERVVTPPIAAVILNDECGRATDGHEGDGRRIAGSSSGCRKCRRGCRAQATES